MALAYRISPDQINPRRLDPWHHKPEFLAQLSKVEQKCNVTFLEKLIDPSRGIAGGATPLGANYLENGHIKFYRTSEIDDMQLDLDQAVFISEEEDKKIRRSRLSTGDIVLTITGAKFGKAAVVEQRHLPGNISQHSVRFHPKKNYIDPYYLAVYLNAQTGQAAIWREAYGATRPAIDYHSLRSLLVPLLNINAQYYIGNKLSDSEKLVSLSKILKNKSQNLLRQHISTRVSGNYDLLLSKTYKKYVHVSSFEIVDRLDAWYYKEEFTKSSRLLNILNENGCSYHRISSIGSVEYGFMPLEDYWNNIKGHPFLRISNIKKSLMIDNSDIKYVNPVKSNYPKYRLVKDDIIVVQLGNSTGRICLVTDKYRNWVYPSFCLRIRIENDLYDPAYVAIFLSEFLGQNQIQRTISISSVRPNTTKAAIESIKIPFLDEWEQKSIGYNARRMLAAYENNMNLIAAAKHLVEALIEGHISEQELISAQQALEAGDNSLDREIMSRLKTDGLDGQGEPLFSDLDQLYSLLDQARETEDEQV